MKFLKKGGLAVLFAGMMTALQGCTVRDAAAAFLVMLALVIPGCGEDAIKEAIAQSPSVTNLSSLFITRETVGCINNAGCVNLTTVTPPSEATAATIRDTNTRESWGWIFKGEIINRGVGGVVYTFDWTGSTLMIRFVPGIDDFFEVTFFK